MYFQKSNHYHCFVIRKSDNCNMVIFGFLPTKLIPVSKWIFQFPVITLLVKKFLWGLPWWLSGKESACQCGRQGFATWSRKIPHTEEHGPQLLSLCSRAGKAQQSSPCAATTEVHASYSLCATREATAMRSLCIATKSSP